MSAAGNVIHTVTERGVTTIVLDHPANRNALSTAMIGAIAEAVRGAVADPAVRAVVLSHTGSVFCSGVDLKETAAVAAGGGGVLPAQALADLVADLWECPKPVLVRVGGAARAGGLGIVAAADIAVCSEDATFAFTEVRLGVVPAVISATVLRRVQPRSAAELYLTGDVFDGRRAAAIGLVSAAVPGEALDAAVSAYTDAVCRGGPEALAGTKQVLHRVAPASVRDDLAELAEISVRYFTSAEAREGMAARRERRDAAWVPGAGEVRSNEASAGGDGG